MTRRDNTNGWIEYVYREWLFFPEEKQSSLLESSQIIVDKMKSALAIESQGDVWYFIERLKKLSDLQRRGSVSDRRTERSETLLECGIVAYKMGNTEEALLLLDEAIAGYTSDWHYRAVSIWIRSCIQWLLPSRIDDAISGWERSRELFKKYGVLGTDAIWYEKRVREMQNAIVSATENDGLLPYTVAQPPSAAPSSAFRTQAKNSSERRDFLRICPVLGQIVAGEPLSLDLLTDWLDIDEVILGDEQERYRVCSLIYGARIIRLENSNRYFLLEVTGNSMNSTSPEPISNKDFVLMRRQSSANNRDIVAVEITGLDNRATLKRYAKEGDVISLLPESDDPRFQSPIYLEREFTEFDDDFSIRGVAIAVFKKITD